MGMWQASHSANLSSRITALEKQLPEEVAKVLEVCNENARGIDKLNNNMMTFMNQLFGTLGSGYPKQNCQRL
jgi:hypothetical protein